PPTRAGAPSCCGAEQKSRTLTTAYSQKDEAKGNFKGGYGHPPLLCYLDGTGEAPVGILGPGTPARTPRAITSWCSTSCSHSSICRRSTARSWCAPTALAPRTS